MVMSELLEALSLNSEHQAALARMRQIKEELFKWAMELEDVAEALGYPFKHDVIECSAQIMEGVDGIEELLPNIDSIDCGEGDGE
jgi:hypothetical protein